MTLCLLLRLGCLRTKLWGEYSKWSQVKYQNELIRREVSACLALRMTLLEWLKNTVTCTINTEATGNEDVTRNLHWILVNVVINVHVSVQLSGYTRETLLKVQHDRINFIFFYVHGSLHRESRSIIVQQDATMHSPLYFCILLQMIRVVTPPIIRSTYNCDYSIWHWSNFGICSMWSQLKMRGMDPTLSATFCDRTIAEDSRDGSIPLIFSWLHTLHFPRFDQCQML